MVISPHQESPATVEAVPGTRTENLLAAVANRIEGSAIGVRSGRYSGTIHHQRPSAEYGADGYQSWSGRLIQSTAGSTLG